MTRSHTMSRGNVLTNLSGNDKLIRFNDHIIPDSPELKDYFSEVLVEDASVTVSFCKKHDEELFAEIEKTGKADYTGTDIQNLEYALKAISFDIYYKIMNIRYLAKLVELNKYVSINPDGTDSNFFENYHNTVETVFQLYPLMIQLLSDLKNHEQKTNLVTVCFELPTNRVNFSLSEILEIDGTFCFVNIINSKNPYIIISYYPILNRVPYFDKMKQDFELFKRSDTIQRLSVLFNFTKILLINSINIYFNKSSFQKLPSEVQEYLFIVHREGTKDINPTIQAKFDYIIFLVLYNQV